MNKLNEILRLRFEAQRSLTDIACAAVVARSTVQEVLRRFAAAQLVWPLPDAIDDAMLIAKLYPPVATEGDALTPDWGKVIAELKRKGVTRKLLWQEYITSAAPSVNTNVVSTMPTPLLSYSQFCARLVEQQGIEPKMRQFYRPGEKLFVDYAGMTVPLIDQATGEIRQAQIFVAALGYSHAIYAEATPTQTAVDWLSAQSRALSFYGGVPDIVVPDNPRALVHKACRYEPTLNPAYAEWARHYGTTVLPARVRTPNDKAKVETAVQIVERKILAPLRDCQFFSLAESTGSADQKAIELLPAIESYLDFVTMLILAFGLCFQLPVILTLLGQIGVVNYEMLSKGRKFAIVGVFVVAAVLTPPDPISQIAMAVPLMGLYEVAVQAVRFIEARRKAKEAKEAAANA